MRYIFDAGDQTIGTNKVIAGSVSVCRWADNSSSDCRRVLAATDIRVSGGYVEDDLPQHMCRWGCGQGGPGMHI